MCMGMERTSILLVFLILAPVVNLGRAWTTNYELVSRLCRDTPAHNATIYAGEFFKVMSSISQRIRKEGYGYGQSGNPPDRIYVYTECMSDLSPNQCVACFNQMAKTLPGCFPSSGARMFFSGCYIRADNYSFFNNALEPDDFMKCGDSVDHRPQFSLTGKKKIGELVKLTVEKGTGFVYKKTNNVFFVAMASCWKTMDRKMCSMCLEKAAQRSFACLPATEARIINSGCAMRYADYDFTNNINTRVAKEIILTYATYVLGGLAASALVVIALIYLHKFTRKAKKTTVSRKLEINLSISKRGLNFLEFNYATLEKATMCFDSSNRLGQGGYGEVFKGTLPDGREIAIKRLFVSGKLQNDDICNEIDIISRAQHKNLVRFLGCCFTNTNSFLVYEFLANTSLDRILFDLEKKKELEWKKRWQIIIGIAEGLEYLHRGSQMSIIHRDIKASNILLDSKFKPKIADFGLARFSSCTGNLISSATIAGTFGYLAPEYLAQGRLTEEVDVYSFGVLVLEIVCGVRNNNKLWSESSFETLVTHVWKHFQSKTVADIVEKSIEIEDIEEVKRVVQVGLLCTQESPQLRPNMTMVIQMLRQKDDIELPQPSKPPFIDEHLELSSSLSPFRNKPSCITDLSHNKH